MEYEYEVLFSDVDIDLSEEHLREKKSVSFRFVKAMLPSS